MSNMTTGLVSPRYRHFIPVAPNLSIPVPGLKSGGLTGGLSKVMVSTARQNTATQNTYILDPQFLGSTTSQIRLYIDSVFITNNYGFFGASVPVYDQYGNVKIDPITHQPVVQTLMEYEHYDYVDGANEIVLKPRTTKPTTGTIIRVERTIGTVRYSAEKCIDILMNEHLLQGATPQDLTVNNPRDPNYQYFQGAYRCILEVITKPSHGVLSIADNQTGFVYQPEIGYYGDDSFMYRIVNCMGQESPCGTITLKVGQAVA